MKLNPNIKNKVYRVIYVVARKNMIIEVSGPSGVGKTFNQNIINSLPKDCLTGSIHSSKTNNCKFIPKYFSEVNSHNIVTDLYSLLWFSYLQYLT